MSIISAQTKQEIKQLPFTLGKLLGGALSVIGFPGMIAIMARNPNPSASDVLPFTLLGISGIAIFLLSSRLQAKRVKEFETQASSPKDKIKTSIMSWLVLVALAAIFLLISFVMTR